MEKKAILKVTTGVLSSVLVLTGGTQLGKIQIQAKEKIEVEANTDVQFKIKEQDGGAVVEIVAVKDITNVDVKVTIDGNKVITYHIESLKAGQKEEKVISKEKFEKAKSEKKLKSLPQTSIVRKSLEKTSTINNSLVNVKVSYDIDEDINEKQSVESSVNEENSAVKPEVKPREPKVKPIEPEVKPTEPEVKPTEPEIKPTEPEVKPTEPEVKPTEPEVKPKEPEVKPREPEVKPTELEVKPTEPEVKPTEPEVKPIEPEVKPTEPEVKPTEPEVKPTEPEVKPTEPEVKPTEPEVKPTEPEVKSTEPEVKPTEPEVKPTERRVEAVEPVFTVSNNVPVMDALTFKFSNSSHPAESVEKTTNNAMLAGEELYLNEEYTLSVNDNDHYSFEPRKVVAKESDGFIVLHDAVTNKPIETLELKAKAEENDDEDIVTLDGITARVLTKDGKAIKDAPFRLFEYDRNIPNIIKELKTNSNGDVTLTSSELKPNTKYELRIEKRDTAFSRESLVFRTDEDAEVVSIDNQVVTDDTTGIIEFREEKTNDENVKIAKAHFKVVDENGNPVENVELSTNGIRTKITTLKNARSDANGIVTLDLEGKVNGVEYIVNISKNDQFNWQFSPDAVNVFVTAEGSVNYRNKDGKYTTSEYNGEEIPVFVVKKVDLNHLKTDLANKITEAEEVLKTNDIKELRDIVNSAKEELGKTETLPIYVNGYLNDLTKELSKVKKVETPKPQIKKGIISTLIVTKNNVPELGSATFEFVNKNNPEDVIEKTSSNGLITGVEVTIGEEYTIRAKNNDNYEFEESVVIRDEDGEAVAYKVGTDDPVVQLNMTTKKVVDYRKEIEFIAVSDEKGPYTAKLTFKFENLKHPENSIEVSSVDGIIRNAKVAINEEYKVTLNNSKYTIDDIKFVAREEDGEVVPYLLGTEDYFDTITLKEKTNEPVVEDEDEIDYRDFITIRALKNGQPQENSVFTLIHWDGKIPNKIREVKTDSKGEVSVDILGFLPVDSAYQLISKENNKKFVTFYSDDEGYLWNINGKEINKKTPKIIDINL